MTRTAWTSAEDDRLKAMWPSARAENIGAAMGRTEKSVFARASKLGLPRVRMRPQGQHGAAEKPAPAPVRGLRMVTPRACPAPAARKAATRPVAVPAAPIVAPQKSPWQVACPSSLSAGRRCCWPTWPHHLPAPPHPPTYCEAVAASGHPYCAEHCGLAYIPARSAA